jgi:hypothetical protein
MVLSSPRGWRRSAVHNGAHAAFEKLNAVKLGYMPAGITFSTVRCYT